MEKIVIWYLVLGLIFTLMGSFHSFLKKLPLTAAMVYLPIGFLLARSGLFTFLPIEEARVFEHIAEGVVIISLFTAGLKLRVPQMSGHWGLAYRLASVSMILTVLMIAGLAHWIFGFSVGAAVLLGAILAPTDPVLASDVQVKSPGDQDPLRFTLTGEAGFNDGTAFPFVMLGLGVLGLHDLGNLWTKWLLVDVLWQIVGGLTVGVGLGMGVAHLILWLRRLNKESVILDDFLTVGLICLSYGVALSIHTYGFLAVFAAGLALRQIERRHSSNDAGESEKMTKAVLNFNEQLERLGEAATVILVGALLSMTFVISHDLWLIPLVLLLIRPVAVYLGLIGSRAQSHHKILLSWFGIRGVGSVFYLMYAVSRGLPEDLSHRLTALVLTTVAVSILVHGVSVTPIMNLYFKRKASTAG